MGGKSHKKPKFTKKKSKLTKKAHKKIHKKTKIEKELNAKSTNFQKKYDGYVKKISEKLDIHPTEASAYLGVAMENAFNGIMLSVGNVSNDQYYSLREKELDSVLHPSMGALKGRKNKRRKRSKRSKRSKRR